MSYIPFTSATYDLIAKLPDHVRPGSLVYSSFHRANVPVMRVGYDTISRQWLCSTPGYQTTADNYSPAQAAKPTHVYVRTSEDSSAKIREDGPALQPGMIRYGASVCPD